MSEQEYFQTNLENSAEGFDNESITKQNKLVRYFLDENRSGDVFNYPEFYSNLSDRQTVLEAINENYLTDFDFHDALSKIKCPMEPVEGQINSIGVFSKIENDIQIKGLIISMIDGDFSRRDEIRAGALEIFYEKFPDPMALEAKLNDFLQMILRKNGQQKQAEYEKAAITLQKEVYGDKVDYFNEIKTLKSEADKLYNQTHQAFSKNYDPAVLKQVRNTLWA